MQIILNQNELMEAVKEMVHQQITINDDQDVQVLFDLDSEDQILARIDISKATDTPVTESETPAPKTRGKRGHNKKNAKATSSTPSNENAQEQPAPEKPPMYPLPDKMMTYDPQSEANGGVPIPAPKDEPADEPVALEEDDSPPFDLTPKPHVTKSVSQLMAEVEQENNAEPTAPSPLPVSNKIFPDPETSAAWTPAPPPPDSEVVAKSLFANLTKAAG